MLDQIVGFLFGIVGAFFGSFITYLFGERTRKRERFDYAGSSFRSKVLYELVGIFPIPLIWQDKDKFRFLESVPRVEIAAAEFRPLLTRKTEFDAAVKAYREYCYGKMYERAFGLNYTFEKDPNDIGPMETFRRIVDHLLSFTVRK